MSLEPDRPTLCAWLEEISAFVADHIEGLRRAPAAGPLGADAHPIAKRVSTPIGEQPLAGGLREILTRIDDAAQASLGAAGPGYMAYVPGGGLPTAAMADLVAGVLNRFTGLTAAAPALCRLEADVLSWLASSFGYDEAARGLLTSGGSLANFSAVVTARHAKLGDQGDYRTARVYTSAQAHHSVAKSVMLAGIPAANVVAVEVDQRLRIDPRALEQRVEADRAAGLEPFLLVSAAGTTNTGAVDPLDELAALSERHGLWHHVDGAYGGAFVLCPQGRERLRGIERSDSVTFDPHKGMFLPYGTGCLLVRQGQWLRRAHQAHAAYLQDFDVLDRSGEAPSPTEYGPELSRAFRGLRLWLPLMLHGAGPFREALSEKLELAEHLAERLASNPMIEVVDQPQLSIVAFRLRRGARESLDQWNGRNRTWLAAINAAQRVHLSSTTLPVGDGDAVTLRACVLSFRTHRQRVDALVEDAAATTVRYTRPAPSPPK